jgi:hypothetical protein
MSHPLSFMLKYFGGSLVGSLGVVEVIKILKVNMGHNVEGVIFRDRIRGSRNKRGNGASRRLATNSKSASVRQNKRTKRVQR